MIVGHVLPGAWCSIPTTCQPPTAMAMQFSEMEHKINLSIHTSYIYIHTIKLKQNDWMLFKSEDLLKQWFNIYIYMKNITSQCLPVTATKRSPRYPNSWESPALKRFPGGQFIEKNGRFNEKNIGKKHRIWEKHRKILDGKNMGKQTWENHGFYPSKSWENHRTGDSPAIYITVFENGDSR